MRLKESSPGVNGRYVKVRVARHKNLIKPVKETNLRVVQALFEP